MWDKIKNWFSNMTTTKWVFVVLGILIILVIIL